MWAYTLVVLGLSLGWAGVFAVGTVQNWRRRGRLDLAVVFAAEATLLPIAAYAWLHL